MIGYIPKSRASGATYLTWDEKFAAARPVAAFSLGDLAPAAPSGYGLAAVLLGLGWLLLGGKRKR